MTKHKNDISIERAFSIIHKPLMTEKSTNLNQFNQYSFVVDNDSTSSEIKAAVEKVFKVKVTKVNTIVQRGKGKMFKGNFGYKKNFKKAIITLAEGNTIDSSLVIK